jgi:hypothetical protein
MSTEAMQNGADNKTGKFTKMVTALRNRNGNKPWVEASIANLEAAIKGIQNGEIGKFLKFMGSCHKYSLQNQMLISVQHPSSEVVAGANKWRDDYGAWIKAGAKAIWILAPSLIDVRNEITGQKETRCVGFFPVRVFAQDQVDKTIPKLCEAIQGDCGKMDDAYKVAKSLNLVVNEDQKGMAEGSINIETGIVQMKKENSPNMKTKTLFHEIAHWIDLKMAGNPRDGDDAEIVAESAAFVVCQALGLDTLEYSTQYVGCWSSMNCDRIHEMLSRIKHAADEIMDRL